MLERARPRAAARVHANDRKRVVRALELWQAGGTLVPEQPASGPPSCGCRPLVVGLDVPRETLAARIRAAHARCSSRGSRKKCALRATWCRRCSAWMPCGRCRASEAIAELERGTLRFATYQRKWMRRIPGIVMVDAERPAGEVADAILDQLIAHKSAEP